jgi:hypothetical protein
MINFEVLDLLVSAPCTVYISREDGALFVTEVRRRRRSKWDPTTVRDLLVQGFLGLYGATDQIKGVPIWSSPTVGPGCLLIRMGVREPYGPQVESLERD